MKRKSRRIIGAIQDGVNGSVDYGYSAYVSTTAVGRYKAEKQHFNNPFVTTYKYYGWNY